MNKPPEIISGNMTGSRCDNWSLVCLVFHPSSPLSPVRATAPHGPSSSGLGRRPIIRCFLRPHERQPVYTATVDRPPNPNLRRHHRRPMPSHHGLPPFPLHAHAPNPPLGLGSSCGRIELEQLTSSAQILPLATSVEAQAAGESSQQRPTSSPQILLLRPPMAGPTGG